MAIVCKAVLSMKRFWPAALKESASRRDREVRVLNRFKLFLNGFKTIKRIQQTVTGRRSPVVGLDGVRGKAKANGLQSGAI